MPHQGPPPSDPNHNLPPDWVAEWDAPDRRWFFVNQRTGERSWDPPRGPPPPAHYTEVHTAGRGPTGSTYQQTEVISQAPQQKNHNLAYGAGGAVAGLAAGALLMHEGHKVEEHWETDKHKFEEDFEGRRDYRDEERRGYGGDGYGRGGGNTIIENQTFIDDNDRYGGGYRRGDDTFVENQTIVNESSYDDRRGNDTIIQNQTIVDDDGYGGDGYRRDEYRDDGFVDDTARWAGNKVQEVEDIPDDAARWAGNKVEEVEDFPEDAARWTGDKVQEVEDIPQDIEGAFDERRDNVEDAFDEGRDDRENYDDDRY